MQVDELAVAFVAHDSIEMDMIVSNLRAEGIACNARVLRPWWDALLRPGPGQLFGDGLESGPLGPQEGARAEVLVGQGDLPRARKIIRALREGKMEGFPEPEAEH